MFIWENVIINIHEYEMMIWYGIMQVHGGKLDMFWEWPSILFQIFWEDNYPLTRVQYPKCAYGPYRKLNPI